MRKGQKGKLDSKSAQRANIRLSKFESRQRRAATDPSKDLGSFLAGILARSEARKFDQRMFGQALDQFFAGITACSKNRDVRFLHDMVGARPARDILQYTFW